MRTIEINMQTKPGILTARTIDQKEWIKNTTNIYEFCSFSKFDKSTVINKSRLVNLCKYLNRIDIIIGTRFFINRKRFGVIISANANQAITFSLLSFIFRNRRNFHILEEIYCKEPIRFRQKIRPFIYKIFLRNVDCIRVSSTNEINNYSKILGIDKNRFWFLPYPSPVKNPEIKNSEENYILSAGKQFRDYRTLIKAIKGTGYKLIIVSDKNSMKGLDTCDEVEVLYNIEKEKYLDLLIRARFVVVPLGNDFCSCGQFAFLEAMSYGKPVIVARVTGSIDYIVDGETGIFYKKEDFTDLREKIILLNENKQLRDKIAREAFLAIKQIFNQDVFVEKHFQLIEKKWQEMNGRHYI